MGEREEAKRIGNMRFKIGDILVCKKNSIPQGRIPAEDFDSKVWVPWIHMAKDVEYKVSYVGEYVIEMTVSADADELHQVEKDLKKPCSEYFGMGEGLNSYKNFFYTKDELREKKLGEIGIE